MSVRHTPGPWSTAKLHRDGLNYINHAPSGTFTDADAHLIAAAPDMYEALKNILMANENAVAWKIDWPAARAALAKAEGRQS